MNQEQMTNEILSNDVLFNLYEEIRKLNKEYQKYYGLLGANRPVKFPKTKKEIEYSNGFNTIMSRIMNAIELRNDYEERFNAPTDETVVQMKNPHKRKFILKDHNPKLSFYNHDSFNESMRTNRSFDSYWFFDLRKKK